MYRLIDSHAHLDEMEDLGPALDRARESGVVAVVAVGVDYPSNNRVLEIASKNHAYVLPALGCHPGNLEEALPDIERNLQFIEDHVGSAVAVGEIGLDYHKKVLARATKDRQRRVLADALDLARRHAKPVLVHSRYAWSDCSSKVREAGVEKAVFHWYTGPVNILRQLLGEGCLASATLAAEYHQEHRRAVREVPLQSLMLETDSPVTYRWGSEHAHRSEPTDLVRVLEAVAALKGLGSEEVAAATTEAARRFFGLSSLGGGL